MGILGDYGGGLHLACKLRQQLWFSCCVHVPSWKCWPEEGDSNHQSGIQLFSRIPTVALGVCVRPQMTRWPSDDLRLRQVTRTLRDLILEWAPRPIMANHSAPIEVMIQQPPPLGAIDPLISAATLVPEDVAANDEVPCRRKLWTVGVDWNLLAYLVRTRT